MKRDTRGEFIFWAATIGGLLLYFFSSPNGLPWNDQTRMALAWAGKIAPLPEMTHPVWGYFVQVFGGKFVAVSIVAAALSGGLIGAMANRYLGWRIGVASAIVWLFLPPVWDRAVIGALSVLWVFAGILSLWALNAVFLLMTRRAREVALGGANMLAGIDKRTWEYYFRLIGGWTVLALSILYAVVISVEHDYTIGEVASVYARTMLDEADGRFVVMGGVADDQMIWEAERREQGSSKRLLSLREDDAYRAELIKLVRREWPAETNLWVAATIGPKTFAELAVRLHPDNVYVMTGKSTTLDKWEARWETMKPYLSSRDCFVPALRRAFAYEANTLANALAEAGDRRAAWKLYWRILEEVDASNVSALINLNELLRGGFVAEESQRRRIEGGMALLRKNENALMLVSACGPVRPDDKVMAEFRLEFEKWVNEFEKSQGKKPLPDILKTIAERGNEMILAYNAGNLVEAGRIARTILARRDGRGFIPANAVMGAVSASEGDYIASAAFYRVVLSGAKQPPFEIYNDFADTLNHLGEYDEAEKCARIAVAGTPETSWLFRLTLAEILRNAKKNPNEIDELLKVVYRQAPEIVRIRVKRDFREK